MTDRVRAKEDARDIMRGSLGSAVGAQMLSILMSLVPFGMPVAQLGVCRYYLSAIKREEPPAAKLFEGFNNASRAVLLKLWQILFTFLWCFLPPLVFTGLGFLLSRVAPVFMIIFSAIGSLWTIVMFIIKNIQYGYAYYIMADNPQLTSRQCLNASVQLTRPNTAALFVVQLSFIGWAILASITAGLLYLFWLMPYMNLTSAGLYLQMKGGSSGEGVGPGPAPFDDSRVRTSELTANQRQPAGMSAEIGLRGVSGMYSGCLFSLRPGETLTVGRDASAAQIVISEGADKVSRTHCRVSFDPQQQLYIVTDLSKNGTFLADGTQLPPQRANRVARGAVICVGDNSFRLL